MGRLMWFWTLYWISIKGVAFRGTLQFMILHVRECSTEYFFPMVSWIQPISSCLPRQDDGHPVVDHGNIVRRSAGKNREYWQIIFKAVDPCQQHTTGFFWRDCILGLPSLSLLPFKIPRVNNNPQYCVSDTEGSLFAQTAYRFWNHNHRPCRWFAQAPLGHFSGRA